ncbi:MAG: glutamate synthase large subunit [Pseudomonadota bacterium]
MAIEDVIKKSYPRNQRAAAARLQAAGVYDPREEHDACGVGVVAAIDGVASRRVVSAGIKGLSALAHRGAVAADGKTGDGAGICLDIAQAFFAREVTRTGHTVSKTPIAVGMIFLPRTDYQAQEACRAIVETHVVAAGMQIYGWRQVPINDHVLGDAAHASCPAIEQILIDSPSSMSSVDLERGLYIIRKKIEKDITQAGIKDFYICSLSAQTVVYKGLFLAEQMQAFYPDMRSRLFVSRFAIFHQRFSTNTFSTWLLAQPFRCLAHNGEINTIRGNVNWMHAHQGVLASDILPVEDLLPVCDPQASDSAILDSVFELLCHDGCPAPMVKTMMVPPSANMVAPAHEPLIHYCNSVLEPWDGPAALAAYHGDWLIAGMDRNGLRPMRFTVTKDGMLIAASETGVAHIAPSEIVCTGHVGPGEMIGVNFNEKRLYRDQELKDALLTLHPFAQWCKRITPLDDLLKKEKVSIKRRTGDGLRRAQVSFGWTMEDLELILHPMVKDQKEPVGSMGDDTPLAVLSGCYRGLQHYFRQRFSQVTNPAIDPLRERQVMSLRTRFGNLGNILARDGTSCDVLQLESPVLTNQQYENLRAYMGEDAYALDVTFTVDGKQPPGVSLRKGIEKLQKTAARKIAAKPGLHIFLSDENVGKKRLAIPMILAVSAVHSYLAQKGLRTHTSLNVRSGECMDTHTFAVLIGMGATTVNAYLAEDTIAARHHAGLFKGLSLAECLTHYRKTVDDGLAKILSKLGISIISSYRGGRNFEAMGLSRALAAEYMPGMPSRISGIGLAGIERKLTAIHQTAFAQAEVHLPVGGLYRYRHGGERHALSGPAIHQLQQAVNKENYQGYKAYSHMMLEVGPINLRDILDFSIPPEDEKQSVSLDQVESVTDLRRRFVTPGMSLGALGDEAHGTLNVAMNRIGAKSDSGEGGEVPSRYQRAPNGDNWNSKIKQIASGRFGVTARYLNECEEIEIKVAQGAKPGEGGQLPGFKVTPLIASLRHATPGVMLISPPPHHDIYSIEDLSQLIYDLKQINPAARVTVKLVSCAGVGTVAVGVAKAGADNILISGHVGGTGASPQTSIKYAGVPWEMGLAETHKLLVLNHLRHRVRLRTDGGLRTGRDVVIAAMLGAEEFGVGTLSLVAMGCIMVRQCHANTCPVGICTQDPKLHERFTGTPEAVVNLFTFMAEDVREHLAKLGFTRLEQIIGRSDLLRQVSRGSAYLDDLDLNALLSRAEITDEPVYCTRQDSLPTTAPLDEQIMADAAAALQSGQRIQLSYTINNTMRTIGTRTSGWILRRWGEDYLTDHHLCVRLTGQAGQSLGAFALRGLRLEVIGDANDYVGKGLSGAEIIVRPSPDSPMQASENVIIGNTVLYGATSGRLFAAGGAGDRFCVRNSGACAVVESCANNGCEYMTGGVAVILGSIGYNFAAGMTGGMAFVYDPDGVAQDYINGESVLTQSLSDPVYTRWLRRLLAQHARLAHSHKAQEILADWSVQGRKFLQIIPQDSRARLRRPLRDTHHAARSA